MIPLAACLCAFSATATLADAIRLNDGTVLHGELGAPGDITIKTPSGEKRVAFALLPPEVQDQYWPGRAKVGAPAPEAPDSSAVTDEDLAALANEVSLDSWAEAATAESFRDPKTAVSAIEQNWVNVYSPKDPVGQNGNWNTQSERARALRDKAGQFTQRHWLELFIKAGDALSRRDASAFALFVGELKRAPLTVASAAEK